MDIKKRAFDYFENFDFNIIPLYNKVPQINWTEFQNKYQSFDDLESFNWNGINGIGAISGIENLRCLDFDKVKDYNIVIQFIRDLGLSENYRWIVKSGSGTGYHIWFLCEDESSFLEGVGGEKSYYIFSPEINYCDHIELRWKNCQTVLPPSFHNTGGRYEFLNCKPDCLPENPPEKIWIGKLLETIKRNCILEKDKQISFVESSEPNKTKIKSLNDYELSILEDAVKCLSGKINNYDEWMRLGFALASLGEKGRKHFLSVSQNQKYNDSKKALNKKFDGLLKDYKGNITLGTLYEIAKKYHWVKPIKIFWNIRDGSASISKTDLIMLLEDEGFGKLIVGKDPVYVNVKNNVVEEVGIVNIKDFVFNYIETKVRKKWERKMVKEALLKSVRHFFCDATLECLRTLELNFVSDTKTLSYFFFKNNFIEVSKNNITPRDYSSLKGVIWKNQKSERSFELKTNESKSVFEQFLFSVCRKNRERYNSLKSAIGYLLHKYKDPACSKAIIFIDEKISDNASGRSGKGLVAKGINRLRNILSLDGRNFNFDKSFAFQSVKPETEIMFFDDVKKNFGFERLFSIIAEGLTIEKKNKSEQRIAFEDSPKILITTNYSLKGIDDSSKDRQFVIEFSDHYNSQHKPADEFGKLFFSEWDKEEFSRFDNFMLECCSFYLDKSLVEYKSKNLARKRLIDETSFEFEEFIQGIDIYKEYNKKDLFSAFIAEYEDYFQLRQNTFSRWTKTYALLYGLDINERKSGKNRFITFTNRLVRQ